MKHQLTVITNKALAHHEGFAGKLAAGLQAHGYEVLRGESGYWHRITTKMVACWSWRIGSILHGLHDKDVLVMERGYIGDRHHWTSLGWNGLNGHGKWPRPSQAMIDSNRFHTYHDKLMKPLREFDDGRYLLVAGQVPNDMSLEGKDLRGFYRAKADWLWEKFGKPIMLRPHPLDKRSYEDQWKGLQNVHCINHGDLDVALSGACGLVCYNSNTAVNSVLSGIPTEVTSPGSMVYKICKEPLSRKRRTVEESQARELLMQKLSWRQWSPEELIAGTPWEMFGLPHEQLESFNA